MTTNDVQNIEKRVKATLTRYINNLSPAQPMIINEMVQRVLEVDDRILDIGTNSRPFEEIFVYKYSSISQTRVRQRIAANYFPDEDEKLIIEPSVTVPITIS